MIFSLNRGEVQTARELGEQMLSLAQRVHDPAGLANAHISLGNALYNLRAWDAARTHLEQGIAFYNAQQHRSQGFLTENTRGSLASSVSPRSCGSWAVRTKPCSGATRR